MTDALPVLDHGFVRLVDLKNLLHFLTLRQHPHAQYEIRQYAAAIIKLITPIVPVTIQAWSDCRSERAA